jgi:HAD superfamily hydrolase (TIGR01509 family)
MAKMNAVIFDMDGLLLDTERIALTTFVDSCKAFDFNPDLQVYYQCIGRTLPATRKILKDGYGESFPLDSVLETWSKKHYEETSHKPIPLKAGATNLLRHLEKEGVKKIVVTSTFHQTALRWLGNADILHYFDFVLGGDQVLNGKPNPEIYLTACQRLNEKPSNCLALEDSDNGVLSATDAGLVVIQVPDLIQPSTKIRFLGHRIVKSLNEVETVLNEMWLV